MVNSFSKSSFFNVFAIEISSSFHYYFKDFTYVKDEFTLQVLRNFPFATRGYVFKNRKLRNFYRRCDWYEPDESSTVTTNDLSISEFEWMSQLKIYEED